MKIDPIRQLMLAYWVLSILVMSIFCLAFHWPLKVILVHWIFVWGLAALFSEMLIASGKAGVGLLSRVLLLLFAAANTYFLILIYVGNFLTNYNYGGMVDINTAKFIADSLIKLPGELWKEGFHVGNQRPGLALAFVALLVITMGFFYFIGRILSRRAHIKTSTSTRFFGMAAVLLSIGIFSYGSFYPNKAISSEPIFSHIKGNPGDLFKDYRVAAADQDWEKFFFEKRAVDQGNRKNLVIIVVDALRNDYVKHAHENEQGLTPFMSRSIESGDFFAVDRTFSVCSSSLCGISAILTSKNESDQSYNRISLQSVLSLHGYKNFFVLSGTHDWYGLMDLYRHRSSVEYLIDGTRSRYMPGDDEIVHEGIEAIPDFSGNPSFLYFHLMSVHSWGEKHPDFDRHSRSAQGHPYDNAYKDGVMQADFYVERVLYRLREKGYLDDTVIFITSDHGDSLGENGSPRGHSQSVFNAEIIIPWLIGGVEGSRLKNRHIASQLDIAPTALTLLGIEVPESWDGVSITRPISDRDLFVETRSHYENIKSRAAISIRDEGETVWKYIRVESPGILGFRRRNEEYLFDLVSDGWEKNNVAEIAPKYLLDGMRAVWENHYHWQEY